MAAGSGAIYTGFVEGLIRQNGGTDIVLPFADKVGTATLNYSSENIIVETFSQNGIKGASGSCPLREECSIELQSENLAWSFLQAAFNTLAIDSDRAFEQSLSVVLETVTGTPPADISTYTLPFAAAAGFDIAVADEDGIQFEVDITITAGSPGSTLIEFDENYTGQKVTIQYARAATGVNNLIRVGEGAKLGEIGVYGRFSGCPDNILVTVPRGIIQSNVSMGAGDGAASAALTVTALRDNFGNFAYLERI